MTILGVDPGYAIVGFGVVRYDGRRFDVSEYGVIRTPAGEDFGRRLALIYEEMTLLLQKHKPDAMSLEQLFFNTNTTTAMGVAQARGCIVLGAAQADVPVCEYTPGQVKQAVTGHGGADKRQVQEMTRMLLRLPEIPKPDDAADALALAVCCAHSAGNPGRLRALRGFRNGGMAT